MLTSTYLLPALEGVSRVRILSDSIDWEARQKYSEPGADRTKIINEYFVLHRIDPINLLSINIELKLLFELAE